MLYPSDLSTTDEESSWNPGSFEQLAYNLMMLNTGSATKVHLLVVSVLDQTTEKIVFTTDFCFLEQT